MGKLGPNMFISLVSHRKLYFYYSPSNSKTIIFTASRPISFRFPKRGTRPGTRSVAPAARAIMMQTLNSIPRETGSVMKLRAAAVCPRCRGEGPGSVSPMTLHPKSRCGEGYLSDWSLERNTISLSWRLVHRWLRCSPSTFPFCDGRTRLSIFGYSLIFGKAMHNEFCSNQS